MKSRRSRDRRRPIEAALRAAIVCLTLAVPSASKAQLALPVERTSVPIAAAQLLVFTIDLATIPERPVWR